MKYLIGIVVIITLFAALAYIGLTYQDASDESIVTATPAADVDGMQVSPTATSPTTAAGEISPEPTNDQARGNELDSAVPDDWKRYASQVHGFTAYHPQGVEVQEDRGQDNDSVRFLYTGSDQPEATDLVDGYSLTFDSGSYDQPSFSAFVNAQAAELPDSPTIREVTEVESYTHPSLDGTVVRTEGRPSRDYLYFQTGEDTYLEVVMIVAPSDSREYGIEAGTVVSSIRTQ